MTVLVLPKYIFLPILSEWLQVVDIGMLDSALCNHDLRPIFLTHINVKSMYFKVKDNSSLIPIMTKSFVDWINLRDISLDYFDVPEDLRSFAITPYLLKSAHYVQRIRARRCDSILSVKLLDLLKVYCVDVTNFKLFQTIGIYEFIVPKLLSVNISHCCKISVDSIVNLIRKCATLKSISLFHCQLVDASPESILVPVSCPLLESLELVDCVSTTERSKIVNLLVEGCVHLSRIVVCGGRNDQECLHPAENHRWRQLTYIDWSDSYQLLNTSLRLLVSDCPLLTTLNLKNCASIRDISLVTVAQHCPLLQSLTVGLCSRLKHDHTACHITNHGLRMVLQCCTDMAHWCIYDCSVTADLVRLIVTHSTGRLQSLQLYSESITVNGEFITELAQYCQSSLTALALNDLDHVSNESLSHLTASCSLLTDLTLINRRPTSTFSTPIVSLANNCSRLVKLHITEDLVNHNANVSRSCYYMLATQCKLIEDLSIANSHEINDLSLIHFTSYCPYVTNLSLVNCWNVVGDCMHEVSKAYNRKLTTLTLVNNNKGKGFLDAALMNTLPVWNRHLTLLDLSHNVNISSKCVTRILRRCGERLTSLNLSYCTELTSLTSTAVVLYCSHLSYLYLDYCPHISEESLFHILERCALLLKLSIKGRLGGQHPAAEGGGAAAAAGGAMSLFWLSDLQSLYPDIVVT